MNTRFQNLSVPFAMRFVLNGSEQQLHSQFENVDIGFYSKEDSDTTFEDPTLPEMNPPDEASSIQNPKVAKITFEGSGDSFLRYGFQPGDVIRVGSNSESSQNNSLGDLEVVYVSSTELHLHPRHDLATEAAAEGTTVTIRANKKVPEGVAVTIKNPTGNDTVYIGHDASVVQDGATGGGFALAAGEAIALYITALSPIYVLGTDQDELQIIFEKNLQSYEQWRGDDNYFLFD